ncbi:MAG: sensor histidine kinase, partial [Chloroflexota bacterium]
MIWPSAVRGTWALAAVTLVSAVLIALAPIFIILPGALQSQREGVATGELQTLAALLASEVSPALKASDRVTASATLARAAGSAGISVVLWDAGSNVLVSAGPEALGMALRPGPEVGSALAGTRGKAVRAQATGGDAVFVAAPVLDGTRVLGAVEIARPLAAIPASNDDPRLLLLAWLGAAGIIALLLAVWLSGRFIRPLRLLGVAAGAVANGHYDATWATSGVGEVDDLGLAFSRMAKALQSSFATVEAERDRLDAVLRHMADGILIADAEGVVSLANPAASRILGIDARAAMGRRLVGVVREHEVVEAFQQCLTDKQSGRDHVETVERASPRRYLRVVATRVGDGQLAQVLLVLQDLTETRRLETVRRDFFANVSHELRTPIAAIKAMVETLEDGALDDPPAARDFVARVHREVDGLSQLVEELLQVS